MNIGIDIRCLMHKNYSGVAEHTYNLLNNIFKIDKNNQYYLFYNSKQDVSKNIPQFKYQNVKKIGFNYPNKILNLSFKIFKYPKIDNLIKNLDQFFIPNLNFTAFNKNLKKTITIYDLSFERYPQFFSLKRNLWHKFINPQKLISSCDKIIAISQNTKNDLIDLYNIPEKNIKVIYSGVDTNIYKKIDSKNKKFIDIKKKYDLPENFIFFLGTLEPRKNIETIIEAFNLAKTKYKELIDLHLIIAGDTGWNYEKIFELGKNSPFTDQIHYIGYVKTNDKPYLYNLAKLFIFPSYYEGFGLPVLEAQACETPVICSNISSFPEIAGDSAFLIKPDNITEISQTIYKLINNKNLTQYFIKKGLKNIKKFTWKNTAQETLDYLTS